jgi:uncharacterized protein (DUF58 family)
VTLVVKLTGVGNRLKKRRRFDYRITLAGAVYVAGFLLVGAAAVNTQRAMLLLIFGLMLGIFFMAIIISRRMLSAVEVQRDVPSRTFADQVVYLGYRLRNRRRRPVMGLELSEVSPPETLESLGAYCLYLPPESSFVSGSRFVARRRGTYVLDRMRLLTRFPFLLVKARRDLAQEDTMIVWPALGQIRADLLVHGASEVSDAAPSRVGSGSDEFFGLRDYRPGDTPRWIHWKRTAGAGRPVVKEMAQPRPDVLYVLLDTQLTDDSPEQDLLRERLIRFAATLIDHGFHREYRVGLATAASGAIISIPAGAGMGHRRELLDALAGIDVNRTRTMRQVVAAMPRRLLRYAQVVAISPRSETANDLAGLRAACRKLRLVTPDELDELYLDYTPSSAAGAPQPDMPMSTAGSSPPGREEG